MNRLLTEIRRLAADVAARPRPNLYAKALLTLYFGAKQRGDGKHLKGIWFLVCMMSALLEVHARGEPLDPDLFPVETDPPNPEQENRRWPIGMTTPRPIPRNWETATISSRL